MTSGRKDTPVESVDPVPWWSAEACGAQVTVTWTMTNPPYRTMTQIRRCNRKAHHAGDCEVYRRDGRKLAKP